MEPYEQRTRAYYQGARAPPPPSIIRGRGSSKKPSPSGVEYRTKKEENFRRTKGAEVLKTFEAETRKSLLCGFDSLEEAIKLRDYENTRRQ